ncbi:signal peptidase I [Oryzihumus leptocrescens]|uniref:Signal peptidase I n=1 Tax=Oryzihumus leptocrescens TaxID=297536 RepID=A0A542ZEH8_9MICO|nr:signal peptidase I [Oryzihumus leptocrescens]TQL58752.1 signal peptidase I [Oryzihumus leptocrescens]
MTRIRRALKAARTLVVWAAFGLALLSVLATASVLVWAKAGHHGAQVAIVESNSMRPVFAEGDLLAITPVDASRVHVGDVITVHESNDTLVTHRLVKVERHDGQALLTTRGDANRDADASPVTSDRLFGRMTGRVAGAAHPYAWLTSWQGRVLTVGPAVAVFLLIEISALWGRTDTERGPRGTAKSARIRRRPTAATAP